MKKGSNPVIRITGAFAFGIVTSQLSAQRLSIFLPAFAALVLVFAYHHRRQLLPLRGLPAGVLLLPVMAAMGFGAAHINALRPGNAVELLAGTQAKLELMALEDAKPCKGGQKLLAVCRGELAGKIVVYLPQHLLADTMLPVRAYEVFQVEGMLEGLGGMQPGYASWLRNQGVFATARANGIEKLGKEEHWMAPLANMRRELKAQIEELMPERRISGLAVAMLLGDRSGLDGDMREDFSRSGLAHILAISGLHVGIVFVFLSRILSIFVVNPRSARLRTILVILLLVAYMLLTGASPAVCRAVMMLSMMEAGKLMFRRHNSLNLMSASALVLLVVDPFVLFNLGFQLSYCAVGGILVLGPRIQARLEKSLPFLGSRLSGSIAVCLAAQICTAPLVAFHFHQFPTFFLLSNLLLLPAVSLAVVLGFSGLLLYWVPGLAQVLFGMLDFVLTVIAWLSGRISALPGAVVENFSLSEPSMLICLASAAGLLGVLYRRELSGMVASRKAMRFPDMSKLKVSPLMRSQAAGLAAAGILILATLVVS